MHYSQLSGIRKWISLEWEVEGAEYSTCSHFDVSQIERKRERRVWTHLCIGRKKTGLKKGGWGEIPGGKRVC